MKEQETEVLVFKTDIEQQQGVDELSALLGKDGRVRKWNVDQEDIDNVLRIESRHLSPGEVIQWVSQLGYTCEELPE